MGSSEELNVTRGQTPGDIDPQSVVTSEEQLRELYRAPSRIAASKKSAVLDEARAALLVQGYADDLARDAPGS